jgi:serine/threonine protein kinase
MIAFVENQSARHVPSPTEMHGEDDDDCSEDDRAPLKRQPTILLVSPPSDQRNTEHGPPRSLRHVDPPRPPLTFSADLVDHDVLDDDEIMSSMAMSRSATVNIDEEGNETVNGFTLWQELGRGASGVVYLAFDEAANETRAIKAIPRRAAPRDNAADMMQEVSVMKKLTHKHIVALHECIDDPEADMVYLVMQYVPSGPIATLSDRGTCMPLPAETVGEYAHQLGTALRYMHRRGVVHGDVKPDNILVDTRHGRKAYLADFGVSRTFGALEETTDSPGDGSPAVSPRFQSARRNSVPCAAISRAVKVGLGTPAFLSPEVFDGGKPGAAADMWAFGVTLYALLFGRLPFDGASYMALKQSVLSAPLTFPPAAPATEEWRGLLRGLLTRDVAHRTTAVDMLQCEHFDEYQLALTPTPSSASMSTPMSPMVPLLGSTYRMTRNTVRWRE